MYESHALIRVIIRTEVKLEQNAFGFCIKFELLIHSVLLTFHSSISRCMPYENIDYELWTMNILFITCIRIDSAVNHHFYPAVGSIHPREIRKMGQHFFSFLASFKRWNGTNINSKQLLLNTNEWKASNLMHTKLFVTVIILVLLSYIWWIIQ